MLIIKQLAVVFSIIQIILESEYGLVAQVVRALH
jgi:hypothetical protein